MAIVRAVETRRWLVRSANTGVSFAVDPAGRMVGRVGLFQEGILYADVVPRQGLSFYVRHGDMPVLVACLVLVVLALFARAPRVGHDDEPETDDTEPEPLIRVRSEL
jgi:apolipoprotein N-acyltransferase